MMSLLVILGIVALFGAGFVVAQGHIIGNPLMGGPGTPVPPDANLSKNPIPFLSPAATPSQSLPVAPSATVRDSSVVTPPVLIVPIPQKTTPQPMIISNELIYRNYVWSYNGTTWTWNGGFNRTGYDYYRSKPHNRENNYAEYALSDYDRQLLQALVEKFRDSGEKEGYTEYDTIRNIVSFVQSLPYTSDKVTTGFDEYPRYPIETLVDNGGDCEDTAILTAALLHETGYGVVLLQLPEHMAVGVKGSEDLPGYYYTYHGSRYYYLETTASGWDVGEVPPEYEDMRATILPLIQVPLMEMECTTNLTGSDAHVAYYLTHCVIRNIGVGTAHNSSVSVAALALSQGTGKVWLPESTIAINDYFEGGEGYAEAVSGIPRGETTQMEYQLYGDNFDPVTLYSELFTT